MKTILIILQLFLAVFALPKENIISSDKNQRVFTIFILVFMFVIFIVQFFLQTKENFSETYSGTLNSPVKSEVIFPVFKLGTTSMEWGGPQNIPAITFANGDYIQVSMVNGKINLTTQIRDNNGNLIGDIINNKWRIYSTQFILDRNFNKNSLEIKNLKGDLTFQVQLSGNEIKIAGYYYTKSGDKIQHIGPWIKDSESIFLYPSIEHPNELNSNGKYSNEFASFTFTNVKP